MNQDLVEIQGTLQADGTVVLDEKPNLSPGRVEVVLRKLTLPSPLSPPQEDWWQFLQRTRRGLEAANHAFMTGEEMQAHIDWLREGIALMTFCIWAMRNTNRGSNRG